MLTKLSNYYHKNVIYKEIFLNNLILFSPFSLSIIFSARIIGPTLGYILGSTCLSIYVDPGHIPNGMDQDHPRYIGAWWIGFIVIAIFLMIFSPMLTLFPSRLPAENETDAK